MLIHKIDVRGERGFEDLITCCIEPLLYVTGQIDDIVQTEMVSFPDNVDDLKTMIFLARYAEILEKLSFFTDFLFDNMHELKNKLDEFGEEFSRCHSEAAVKEE